LSAAELSRRTGIRESRISEWGRGRGEGSQSPLVFLKLAKALGVTADFLLDDSQESFRPALNDDEKKLLEIAREMGFQVAFRRLLHLEAPGTHRPAGSGETTGHPPAPRENVDSRDTG
jgi:transcriptional regulator with XRE-family HTH domain